MHRLTVVLLCILQAAVAWAVDGTALLAQVDRNMTPDSFEMYRKLINIEPDGRRKEYVLYTAKKGRQSMAALFLSPATEEGRTTLRVGESMWIFIPDVGRPLRITSLTSVVGGIFNNSDIMRLEFSVEYNVAAVEEQADQYILSLKAKDRSVAYDRLKMWVDKKTVLPATIECYAASGLLIKTLRYKKVKDYGDGIVRPSMMETDSPLWVGYKAVMVFGKIRRRDFPDEVFTLNFMPRIKEVR